MHPIMSSVIPIKCGRARIKGSFSGCSLHGTALQNINVK